MGSRARVLGLVIVAGAGLALAPGAARAQAGTTDALDLAPFEGAIEATLAALPCSGVEVDATPGGALRLAGFVASDGDGARLAEALARLTGVAAVENRLEVQPWPFCELLQITAPYRAAGPVAEGTLTLASASGSPRLRQGEELILDVALPPEARYLYLGYLQHDGRVGYITTMAVGEWAAAGHIRLRTGFEIAEPFGHEMVVAITSRHPLFERPRPAYEAAESYLAALRARLAALWTATPDAALAATYLVLTTERRRAS